MKASVEDFEQFRIYLTERGLTDGTYQLYARNLRHCFADRRGILARISLDDLAPKTRRTNKAAMIAWCRFRRDSEQLEKLRDMKLPPPDRIREKVALERDEWRAVLAALDSMDPTPEITAISMVCLRGFRIGDVCRLERRDVRAAINSGLLNYRGKGRHRVTWTVDDSWSQHLEFFQSYRTWGSVADIMAPACRADRRYEGARLRAQRAFPQVLDLAGVDREAISLHSMRRTYAWHYLKFCGDPVKLQKHMGWKSIQTAMQYVDQSQRAELDDIAATMMQDLTPGCR